MTTTIRLLILSLICATAAVHADEYQDVNQLMAAGKLSDAMNKVDAFLATKPADPQMRFLKGVLQRNSGKQTEAIATFIKLTEDFPVLSEPYNNLAVIYAGQSQFDKARAALEMAISITPGYATTYENLGDVYARLASQNYSKALELDISNAVIPAKLTLMREAFKPIAKNPPVMATKPVVAAAAAVPAKAELAAKPAMNNGAANKPENEVEKAVTAWAKAWSSQDVSTYLAAYSKEFHPPGTQTHAAWAQQRKARISKKSGISVSVENLSIKVSANQAIVNFRQDYRAGALHESSRKILELNKVDDQWLIAKETTVK